MPVNLPIVTIIIITITTLISIAGFNNSSIIERFKFNIDAIRKQHDFLRLLSSGFLHADYGHLFFNMFSLYSFADHIELLFGIEYIVIIYFAALLGGSFLSLLFHRNNVNYSAVGASGAVCGIIFASIFLVPGGSVIIFFIPIPIPAYLYAVLFIVISIFGIKTQRDNIGHEAHLGGALTGMFIVALFFPEAVFANSTLFLIIVIISLCFLVYSFLKPQQ